MAMLKTIERYTPADLDVLGIPPENFELITAPEVWRVEHRDAIMSTFGRIVFGSLKIMGLPPITVPSEFLAAVIATLIAPENHWVMCAWAAQEKMTGAPALELAARAQQPSQWDPTSADALAGLVILLMDADETNYARQRFLHRLGLRVIEAERREKA